MSERIRICVARDPGEGVTRAYLGKTDDESKEYAILFLCEDGFSAAQLFWVEVEIPDPPTLTATVVPDA